LFSHNQQLSKPLATYRNVGHTEFELERRYNDFELLYSQLSVVHRNVSLPKMPEKNFFGLSPLPLLSYWLAYLSHLVFLPPPPSLSLPLPCADRFTDDVIKGRVASFNDFLGVVSNHDELSVSPYLLNFLELAEKLGVKVEDPPEMEPSLMRRISSGMVGAFDYVVEGFDKTVEAIGGVFKGNSQGASTSNDRVLQQDQDRL